MGDDAREWHGSPASDVRSFYPEPAADEAELLSSVSEIRLLSGHTYLQFRRVATSSRGAAELINPGSVGPPLDGDPRGLRAPTPQRGGEAPPDRLRQRRQRRRRPRALRGCCVNARSVRSDRARPPIAFPKKPLPQGHRASILARPEGRAQLTPASSVSRRCSGSNPRPTRRPGATRYLPLPRQIHSLFQSSPDPKAGRNGVMGGGVGPL